MYIASPPWAPAAFLACAACTETLQRHQLLLRGPAAATVDASVTLMMDMWSSACNLPCATGVAAHKQSVWDKPVIASA